MDLRRYLKRLDARKPVIWAGDLNVAHEEIGIETRLSSPKFITQTHIIEKSVKCKFKKMVSQILLYMYVVSIVGRSIKYIYLSWKANIST